MGDGTNMAMNEAFVSVLVDVVGNDKGKSAKGRRAYGWSASLLRLGRPLYEPDDASSEDEFLVFFLKYLVMAC